MENQRDSESETGESDTPNVIPQNLELPRPNSRTRTSSEEELTLLSENADPNVQDPHQRNSIFWIPIPQSSNSPNRTRASTSAAYHLNNVPRRVRQHRPWTSRERYFHPSHIQQPYLYYRQYLRQEILRTYMARSSPRHRNPPPPILTIEPNNSGPACAYVPPGPHNLVLAGIRIVSSPIRYGVNSASSNSSTGSNNPSQPASVNGPQSNVNGVEVEDRFNFIGLGEFDIMNNTRLIMNTEDHDDDVTCVICMSLTRKFELLRKLPCRHIFHKECIDKWLGFNGICPTCRRDIRLRRQSTPPAAH